MNQPTEPPAFTNPKKSPKKPLLIGGIIVVLVLALLACLEFLTWK